ncbi:MAG: copper amine oxidase N-terminal domain-containing protein, partial [Clostridiales bacterium]|nr:copper amine oxidase N-terminal domain-containing protein [Clostridiales bacterium]
AGDVTGTDGLSEVIDYEIEYGEGSKYGEKNILLIGIINSEANRARAGSLIIDGLELKAAGEAPLGEVKLRVSGAGIPYERFTVAKFTYNPSQSRSGASYTVKLVDGFSQMSVNDSDLVMDTEPYILNNRFMLPVSYVAVAFGIPPTYDNIKWDGENRTVTVIDGDNEIKLSIGSKVMFVNGGPFEMDTTAVIQDNRTFVPMRALAEALGFDVEWDGQTRTAILTK